MYKGVKDTVHLKVDVGSLKEALKNGRNTLITLKLDRDGKHSEHTVMVKELQYEPVYDRLTHVDFIGIDMDKPLEVEVPLELDGTPVGVTTGGILQQILRKLLIRCLPAAIPRSIMVDVREMKLNDSLHVRDIKLPEGAECIEDADGAVASVLAPQIEVVEKKVEEVEAAEGEPEAAAEKKEGEPEEKKEEQQREK
jgi:large subunit ribosomal protein L25